MKPDDEEDRQEQDDYLFLLFGVCGVTIAFVILLWFEYL